MKGKYITMDLAKEFAKFEGIDVSNVIDDSPIDIEYLINSPDVRPYEDEDTDEFP